MQEDVVLKFMTEDGELLFLHHTEHKPPVGDIVETLDSRLYKVIKRVWHYDNYKYSNPIIDIYLREE